MFWLGDAENGIASGLGYVWFGRLGFVWFGSVGEGLGFVDEGLGLRQWSLGGREAGSLGLDLGQSSLGSRGSDMQKAPGRVRGIRHFQGRCLCLCGNGASLLSRYLLFSAEPVV